MVSIEAPIRKFTVAEYQQMAEAGILHEDDRVELIEGKIVEMAPIGSRDALCVDRLNRVFLPQLQPSEFWLRVQNPIRMSEETEPQPDIVVAKGDGEKYVDQHPGPGDILLIIEVADSSLVYDRRTKVPLYAKAGIPEFWLIDLVGNRVEVYREPAGEGFQYMKAFGREDAVSPLFSKAVVVTLHEILP